MFVKIWSKGYQILQFYAMLCKSIYNLAREPRMKLHNAIIKSFAFQSYWFSISLASVLIWIEDRRLAKSLSPWSYHIKTRCTEQLIKNTISFRLLWTEQREKYKMISLKIRTCRRRHYFFTNQSAADQIIEIIYKWEYVCTLQFEKSLRRLRKEIFGANFSMF